MVKNAISQHLIDISELTLRDVGNLFIRADAHMKRLHEPIAKEGRLRGRTLITLFCEPSTRTRLSFEIAATRLGADIRTLSLETSSAVKGESLTDTVLNLEAMGVNAFIIRHSENGVLAALAPSVKSTLISAGEGTTSHPSQALLDAFTIRAHKKSFKGLTVAIVGDLYHSRVARSNIALLTLLGAEVHLIAPRPFMIQDKLPPTVSRHEALQDGLRGCDVVMMLRLQKERFLKMTDKSLLKNYHELYGLNHEKLKFAKKDAIVMHPGPINRGTELSSELADDPKHSVILEQVSRGVAMRMAILETRVETKERS